MLVGMLDRITEQLLEDEALTDGLTDEDASELLGWLVGIAEDIEKEGDPVYMKQLKRLGHEVAQLARKYKVPVDDLIELIEIAWEDPSQNGGTKPMQA